MVDRYTNLFFKEKKNFHLLDLSRKNINYIFQEIIISSYRFLIQRILYDYSFDIGYNDLHKLDDGTYEMQIYAEGYRGKNLIFSISKKITFKQKKIKDWRKFGIANFHVEGEKNKILFNITEVIIDPSISISGYSFYIPRNKHNKEEIKKKLKNFVNKFNKEIH